MLCMMEMTAICKSYLKKGRMKHSLTNICNCTMPAHSAILPTWWWKSMSMDRLELILFLTMFLWSLMSQQTTWSSQRYEQTLVDCTLLCDNWDNWWQSWAAYMMSPSLIDTTSGQNTLPLFSSIFILAIKKDI